ncbi:MAG: hypothetical protein KC464_32295 [Myxococcales bacterium]|nr:hypothetical protein [Myxococcales bacterium]
MSYGRLLAGLAAPLASLLLVACQKGDSSPPVAAGYRDDVSHICDVMSLSGADQQDEGSRTFIVASWLGANVTSEDGHAFLVRFQQTPDPDKPKVLRDEAKKVGLGDCALATMWEPGPP